MGAGRKKETYTLTPGDLFSPSTTPSHPFIARNLHRSRLGGVIFGCTHDTMAECFSNKLFGLPFAHIDYVGNISIGLPLFLFNYSDRKLHGVFEADSHGKLYIDESAWTIGRTGKTHFPAQVSIRIQARCQPLSESQYKPVIESNYYTPNHFFFELDHAQTKQLIALFKPLTLSKCENSPAPIGSISSKLTHIPASPGTKWSDIVKNKQVDTSAPKALEDQEPAINLVDMLSKEENFPSLPATKCKDRGTGERTKPMLVSSEDGDSTDTSSGQNSKNPLDDLEYKETVLDWEELAERDYQQHSEFYGQRQNGQKRQSANEESESQEQRVLRKLEVLAAARQQSVPCVQNVLDMQEHNGHMLDTSNISSKKQKMLKTTDPRAENEEILDESYMNLGVDELVQDKKKLEERIVYYQKCKVESDREAVNLRNIVRDLEQNNQILKNRVKELESKIDHSIAPDHVYLDKCVEQYIGSNDVIYLIGGFDGSEWLSSLECFSPSLDTLTPLKPMSSPRAFTSSVSLDGILYVFGGGCDEIWSNTAECYNRRNDEWTSCAPMLCRRGSLGGATLNGKIYAIGGADNVNIFSDVEIFDPILNKWSYSQSMVSKRFAPAATELNGVIYALGGFDGKNYLRSTERYDPREGYWRVLPSMNIARGSHSVIILNEKLYCIGGYDGEKMVSDVEIYEPRLNTWVLSEPMSFARGYASVSVLGNSIIAIGGVQDNKNTVDTVEYYKETTGWMSSGWRAIGKRCFSSAVVLK